MNFSRLILLVLLLALSCKKKESTGETWGHGYYSTLERLNGHVKQVVERRTGGGDLFLFTNFDKQGHMTSYVTRVSPQFTMHYKYTVIYDKNSKKTQLVGFNTEFGDRDFYIYNANGKIVEHNINNNIEVNHQLFKYDNDGNMIEEHFFINGQAEFIEKFQYDENNLWTTEQVFSGDGSPLIKNNKIAPYRLLDAKMNWIKTLYGKDTVYRKITYY
jgi:hypothetical protein